MRRQGPAGAFANPPGIPLSRFPASLVDLLPARLREGGGRRLSGAVFALLVQALLVLMLLTLGRVIDPPRKAPPALVSIDMGDGRKHDEPLPKKSEADNGGSRAMREQEQPILEPTPPTEQPQPPVPQQPTFIPVSRNDMAAFDLSRIPAQPKKPGPAPAQMGPVGSGPADTPMVSGSGPNGEPLYAAAWYREPYDNELRGYLSTASGPGWGLIACRTVPDYRVEDCIALDEYPNGSNIARAVLAAAWQFRVRPPRLGGKPKIGEWVRIRIDYGIERRPARP